MRGFLRGCQVGLFVVGVLLVGALWYYMATLIIDTSLPLLWLLYIAGSIILFFGGVGWFFGEPKETLIF